MGKYSEELDREMEENQRKVQEANQQAIAQAQQQAMAMQEQIMEMQRQAMAAGGMTPEMMQQMQAQAMQMQQQMMGIMGGEVDMSGMYGDDEEEEQAKEEFVAAHPQPEGTSKYLAMGSFFTVMRDEPLETLEMMGDVEDYVEEMDDSWGVDDRESLIKMIESLLAGRAFKSYNDTYLAIKAGKTDDVDEDDVESYQETVESLGEVLDISLKDINKCSSILGWDLERAAYLARTGAHAEYITKEEAWDYLKRAAAQAKDTFGDWTEYAVSIVMGRAVHMGYHEVYFYLIQELLVDSPEFLAARPIKSL